MLDRMARRVIDPAMNRLGAALARSGATANAVTLSGLVPGAAAFFAIVQGWFGLALILILLNRLCDGLDGAVARHRGATDLGGFLDIVSDFIFYSAVPLAFAVHDPALFALPAAFLIFSFVGTGCSFLAYAIIAEKRGITTDIRGRKSFYYLGGLTEGTETIATFVLFCLLPQHFALIAWVFGALCWITTATRIAAAWIAFGKDTP